MPFKSKKCVKVHLQPGLAHGGAYSAPPRSFGLHVSD